MCLCLDYMCQVCVECVPFTGVSLPFMCVHVSLPCVSSMGACVYSTDVSVCVCVCVCVCVLDWCVCLSAKCVRCVWGLCPSPRSHVSLKSLPSPACCVTHTPSVCYYVTHRPSVCCYANCRLDKCIADMHWLHVTHARTHTYRRHALVANYVALQMPC